MKPDTDSIQLGLDSPEVQDETRRLREQAEAAAAYRRVFGSADGRRVLADLSRLFSPCRPRFTPAARYEPIPAAIADGQSQVVLHILSRISAAEAMAIKADTAEQRKAQR